MDAFESLVEDAVRRALEAGLFERLPGAGKPLELEDVSAVPAELRSSYILLRSAGVLPDELALSHELLRLDDLLAACDDDAQRARLRREHAGASLRLALLRERRGFGAAHLDYAAALQRKLARGVDSGGATSSAAS